MEKKSFKKRLGIILAIILAVAMVVVVAFIFYVNKSDDSNSDVSTAYANSYTSKTSVGYNAEYLGTVERNIPTATKDEGLVASGTITAYPTYGTNSNYTTEQKDAVIAEASTLCAKPTINASGTYDKMDKDGYLYLKDGTPVLDSNGNQRQLYKHVAAESMYEGSVSDDEPGIIKRVTLTPRGYSSYSVTGVYAPAGEVIKIQISEEDMEATGGITIHIGQALYNGKANNIWSAKTIDRMPVILNTMEVTKETATLENGVYTAYVGSYLGGPIYVRNTSCDVTVTISGGVRYSHYILGYTTKEEFEANATSSAPYFDLEVRNYGVLHSGPKKYAQSYSYEDLYKVAVLWEKISLVSTQGSSQGIVFLYDPFVAAGAAVAFPTQMSVNCPSSWMTSALSYKTMTESGAWGVMHEYNHNFQYYGVGNGGEVTNNGMTLVEYSLFTRVSSSRGIDNYGAENMSDWNLYTSATWALDQIVSEKWGNGKNGLAIYATLLQNFGQDNYIQSKLIQRTTSEFSESYEGYLGAWTQQTHYNMSYFFNELLGADVSDEFINTYTDSSYPMFVPVSCVYQTGRSYLYDNTKYYTETMQPYKITYGEDFTIDLSQYTTTAGVNSSESGQYVSGSVVLPNGFSYKVKSVSQPENGTITKVSDYVYKFTPNDKISSGKIYVTLEITNNDTDGFDVEDVELVLEFEQSHEMTKTVLEKTIYSYTENFYDSATGTFTTTAAEAFKNNFEGYASVETVDNVNPTLNGRVVQDCNADVWYLDKLQNDGDSEGDGVADESVKTQVIVLSGKIYVSEEGKYRIAMRGRKNVALFISTDGGSNYELATEYTNTSGGATFPDTEGTYKDLELEADSWVYFKAVLVRYYGEDRNAFMGVGWGQWTEEEGTAGSDDYVAPTVKVSYATAYRSSYVNLTTEEFNSDYFYTRKYSYAYSDITTYDVEQELVTENCKYTVGWGHNLENLVNGNDSNYFHTSQDITASNPLIIEAKLAETITANRLIFDGSHNSENKFLPKNFKIWVSSDGEEWQLACDVTDAEMTSDGWQVIADFDGMYTFSYYKFEVTAAQIKYVALRKIIFQKNVIELEDGNQLSPDDETLTYKGGWSTKSTFSTFGHVYVGEKNATLEFEFDGTRLGILSAANLGTNYKVEIDGVEVTSIELKENSGIGASFISEELSSGKHTVKITCLASANIDSVVIW